MEEFCDFVVSKNQRVFISRLAETAAEIAPQSRISIFNIRNLYLELQLEELNCERVCLCTEEILGIVADSDKQKLLAKAEFNPVLM